VFRATLALTLASAASLATAATSDVSSSSTLNSTAPWWEKVTVTISGDGQPQSCKFESSLTPGAAKTCDVQASAGAQAKLASSSSSKDQYTRITFERRFSPGAQGDATPPTGDMLLGQQVMALAIGSKGTVQGCRIVEKSGDMQPGYGCKEASAEKFQASARSTTAPPHAGFMTILVYGHQEHAV
jgi:hypothetical protein